MSAREAEVLDAVAAHLSNAQIAGRLHISVRTVESHVRSLLRKFGAADRRELAALAPAATSHIAAVELPAPWTSFVGRERERATVLAALGGGGAGCGVVVPIRLRLRRPGAGAGGFRRRGGGVGAWGFRTAPAAAGRSRA